MSIKCNKLNGRVKHTIHKEEHKETPMSGLLGGLTHFWPGKKQFLIV